MHVKFAQGLGFNVLDCDSSGISLLAHKWLIFIMLYND